MGSKPVFVAFLATLLSGFSGACEAQEAKKRVITSGPWSAWVESSPATDAPLRAIPYRQVVYRRGPGDDAPVEIFRETSERRLTISLAADGRLLVNPVGQGPRVYFKDPKQVVTLPLLPPNQWDKAFPPYYRLNGDAWFLGDVLFYGRYAYVGHYLIGFVRFAPNRACIVEQRLVAEVMDDPGQTVDNVDGARFASPAPVRVGDYVFWRNRGDATADPPWKEQRTWIVDLEQARLCDIRELDNGFVNQQRDKLRAFLSDGGPNKPDAGDDK